MRNIVFLINNPLISRDLDLYGVNFFSKKGYPITFLCYHKCLNRSTHKQDIKIDNQLFINNWKESRINLQRFKNEDSIFLTDIQFSNQSFTLFWQLSCLNIKYSFLDNWHIFISRENPYAKLPLIKKLIKNIKDRHFIWKLDWAIKSYIFKYFIRKPEKIFKPTQVSHDSEFMCGNKSKIIPYAVFDNDKYLEVNKKALEFSEEKFFIFTDQFLDGHPDHLKTEKKYPVTQKYFDSINYLIKQIKEQTGYKCYIACHPRRINGSELNFIADKYLYYKTAELSREAKFILGHYSISFNFAILWNKPVILVVTDELLNNERLYPTICKTQKLFGCPMINADNKEILPEVKQIVNSKINKELYNEFILNHISFNKEENRNTLEIIYENIQNE